MMLVSKMNEFLSPLLSGVFLMVFFCLVGDKPESRHSDLLQELYALGPNRISLGKEGSYLGDFGEVSS